MGDLAFAKQFLTSLDNKSNKYQPDHVFDPKTFQLTVPYTLPKLSTPPHPPPPTTAPASAPAPGSESSAPTVEVTLKSARNPNMTLALPSVDPTTTTLQALKEQVQSYLGGPDVVALDKIKILLNKKPVPSNKRTVGEALGEAATKEVEFGVMVMGGAPDPPPQTSEKPPTLDATMAAASAPMEGVEPAPQKSEAVQPGEPSGETVLQTPEFWDDLQGFLEQRTRSAEQAQTLRGLFERAWTSSRSAP